MNPKLGVFNVITPEPLDLQVSDIEKSDLTPQAKYFIKCFEHMVHNLHANFYGDVFVVSSRQSSLIQ